MRRAPSPPVPREVPERSAPTLPGGSTLAALLLIFPALLTGTALAQEGGATGAPLVTEVPDLCELLTPADASELLKEETGEGQRHDATGFPCQYRAESGRRLTVVAHLGTGPGLEGTQPKIMLDYCRAQVVREYDDLGVAAVLYRGIREDTPGCGGHTLWVATGVRFRGKTNPHVAREREGQFHLLVTVDRVSSEKERVQILRQAARSVLDELRERGTRP